MRFQVEHLTTYTYSSCVSLSPQILKLQPRSDRSQCLLSFECQIEPNPILITNSIDLEGNAVIQACFARPTSYFQVKTQIELETLRSNPFDYLVESNLQKLPAFYPQKELDKLAAYRHPGSIDASVIELANWLAKEADSETITFLTTVTQYLHDRIKGEIRHKGSPQTPEVTLTRKQGACRDLAVLFMAICRQQGLACRFVSGYQARETNSASRRYLHAWPEVYIPGSGWRGYDPTRGAAVADRHLAVAAARIPKDAAPIRGSFWGSKIKSQMDVKLSISTS